MVSHRRTSAQEWPPAKQLGGCMLFLSVLLPVLPVLALPAPMDVRWRRHLEWYVGDQCYELPGCEADWDSYFSDWRGQESADQFADHAISLGVDSMLIDALPSGAGRTPALAAGHAAGVRVFKQLEDTSQDWFGQVVRALKARGLGVFAYLNLIFNADEVAAHPSHAWCNYNHTDSCPDGITATCLNAPDHLSTYANLSQQLIELYGVDAVRYDGLMMPIDHHCAGCQAYYRELYGEELPAKWAPHQWRRQLDFARASYGRTVRTLRQAAIEVKPEILTWFNGFLFDPATVSPYTAPMQLSNSEDARLYENVGFLEFGSPFMQAWTSGVVSPTSGVINGELFHEVKPGPALEKAMRQSHESVAQGGIAYQYLLFNRTTGMPDDCSSIDYPYYCYNTSMLKDLHRRIAQIQPLIEKTAPTAAMAIVYAEQTRLRYGSYDRSSYLAVLEQLFTSYRARSVSVLVLSSLDLTSPEILEGLEVLILPETSGLSVAQLSGLERWVRGGGTLLASGDALRFNETGFELAAGLPTFLGVTYKATHCWQAAHTWALNWTSSSSSSSSSFSSSEEHGTTSGDAARLSGEEAAPASPLCVNEVAPEPGTTVELTGSIPNVNPGGPYNLLTIAPFGQGRAAYLALKFDNSVGPGWPSIQGQVNLTVPTLVAAIDRLLLPPTQQPLQVLSPIAATTSAAVVLTSQPELQQLVLHFLTADLVEVELSSAANVSRIVQLSPPSGWVVAANLTASGSMRVRVLSVGTSVRQAFRCIVLKSDDEDDNNSHSRTPALTALLSPLDAMVPLGPARAQCMAALRRLGVMTRNDLEFMTDHELELHCQLTVIQRRRLRAQLMQPPTPTPTPTLDSTPPGSGGRGLNLTVRRQHKSRAGRYSWNTVDSLQYVDPTRTALVIIDMWEKYWCPSDRQAQVALAAAINLTAFHARQQGILIVHAPSDTLPSYVNSSARHWVTQLPNAPMPNLSNITLPHYPLYPCLDYPHGCWPSCDSYWGDPAANEGKVPWEPCDHCTAGETLGITIEPHDAVVDTNSLQELANVMAARSISTLLYTGVATNMCVMERAWGMINAKKMGLEPLILRELTETAYSPYESPYVSKEESTALMVGFIEKWLSGSASMFDVTLQWKPEVPPPMVSGNV